MTRWMRILLVFLLVLIMVCLPMAGCQNGQAPDAQTEQTTVLDTEAVSEPSEPNWSDMPFAEEAGSISVFGTPLSEFRIVIPEEYSLFEYYAAQNLSDYIYYNTDTFLRVVTDKQKEVEHELIIGATNREGSLNAAVAVTDSDSYVIMRNGGSIVLYGEDYMVGGAAGAFVNEYAAGAWRGYDIDITDIPDEAKPQAFIFQPARNAILLIGDGMGKNHIDMTFEGTERSFAAYSMPVQGELITKSQSVINGQASATDSAAAGTALSTGYKTLNGYVGLDPAQKKLTNVREVAHIAGANTAVLSTDLITGATPAAFLVHVNNRNHTEEIQAALDSVLLTKNVNNALGGLNDQTFMSASVNVLQSISKQNESFFIMIEEGYIDKNAHSNNAERVKHAVKRFDAVIAYCMEFVMFHPDTVLIVTADHETGGIEKDGSEYCFTTGNHTDVNVPLFAMGTGTEYFDGKARDNTRVPTFIATLYSDKNFGDAKYSIDGY